MALFQYPMVKEFRPQIYSLLVSQASPSYNISTICA